MSTVSLKYHHTDLTLVVMWWSSLVVLNSINPIPIGPLERVHAAKDWLNTLSASLGPALHHQGKAQAKIKLPILSLLQSHTANWALAQHCISPTSLPPKGIKKNANQLLASSSMFWKILDPCGVLRSSSKRSRTCLRLISWCSCSWRSFFRSSASLSRRAISAS